MSLGGNKLRSKRGADVTWLKTSGIIAVFIFLMLLALPGKVLADDDYPAKWRDVPMDSVFDNWRMYNRECVSFVAWKLSTRNGFNMPFSADASKWAGMASSRGYTVNKTPAVGAVAYTGGNHAAWVEAVDSVNGQVTVEEYNNVDSNGNGVYGDDGTYSRRTVSASSFAGYIHFKDIVNESVSVSPGYTPAPPANGGVSGLNFLGSERLGPNQSLSTDQYILSPNTRYALVMQNDGNLVVYGDGFRALWASGTAGSGAVRAVMQSDGNLVLYRANWTPVWASNTAGRGSSNLIMQDDGNLVVYASNWSASWNSRTGGRTTFSYIGSDRFANNQALRIGEYLRSADKRFSALLQPDGNLVVSSPAGRTLWASGTAGSGAVRVVMQSDGNLVLYTSANRAVWDSKTAGNGLSFAVIQNDGNYVVYTYGGKALWNTQTNGWL